MSDLIDRQAALEEFYQYPNVNWTSLDVMEKINELPSAQPKQDEEFIKLIVRNSNGRPYYSIIYLVFDDNGVGHDLEGYSSYSLDVISDYLKKYFMPSAQPEPISEEYAKAVRTWLINYQVRCAELQGRYTPYEILGWIVSDWRKENEIW